MHTAQWKFKQKGTLTIAKDASCVTTIVVVRKPKVDAKPEEGFAKVVERACTTDTHITRKLCSQNKGNGKRKEIGTNISTKKNEVDQRSN